MGTHPIFESDFDCITDVFSMRSRSSSCAKLDIFASLVEKTLCANQDPITGLYPSNDELNHAWIRDNLYAVQAVWGLALAYRKTADTDDEKSKCYEYSCSAVKTMRSLLNCMMRQ